MIATNTCKSLLNLPLVSGASGGILEAALKELMPLLVTLRMIWYSGELNTLTFKGTTGDLAIYSLTDLFNSMPALVDSRGDPSSTEVSNLNKEVSRLHSDLEEEKFKNSVLELEVNRHRNELLLINSLRNGSVSALNNTDQNIKRIDDNIIEMCNDALKLGKNQLPKRLNDQTEP